MLGPKAGHEGRHLRRPAGLGAFDLWLAGAGGHGGKPECLGARCRSAICTCVLLKHILPRFQGTIVCGALAAAAPVLWHLIQVPAAQHPCRQAGVSSSQGTVPAAYLVPASRWQSLVVAGADKPCPWNKQGGKASRAANKGWGQASKMQCTCSRACRLSVTSSRTGHGSRARQEPPPAMESRVHARLECEGLNLGLPPGAWSGRSCSPRHGLRNDSYL